MSEVLALKELNTDYKGQYMENLTRLEIVGTNLEKAILLVEDILNDNESSIENLYLSDDEDMKMRWAYNYRRILLKLDMVHDYNHRALQEVDEGVEAHTEAKRCSKNK